MNGAAGAAAVAAIIQAVKASGAIVRVEPDAFRGLVSRNPSGLVVRAPAGLFSNRHAYLMSYKGLAFYTKSHEPIALPATCEMVEARKIWVPG